MGHHSQFTFFCFKARVEEQTGGLKLAAALPLPPVCWDYRCAHLDQAPSKVLKSSFKSLMTPLPQLVYYVSNFVHNIRELLEYWKYLLVTNLWAFSIEL